MNHSSDVLLLDTSAAMALVDPGHAHHAAVLAATRNRQLGLSGHAAFELLSVLTRLPFPSRLSGAAAVELMTVNFPHTRHLDDATAAALPAEFAQLGILGGAVFDGLVAACARAHGCTLITCDRRAEPTYKLLGVTCQTIGQAQS